MATTKSRKLETSNDMGENTQEENNASASKIETQPNQFLFFDSSIARMMGWPVEVWLRTQTNMLKAVQPVATGWIERRREAATAALDTFEKLAQCNDLQEAAAIQRDWFEGQMRRLDTDLHALADHAVAISQEAMSATRFAAHTSSEMAGRAMQTARQNATRGQEMVHQATDQAA
jgi:hypothetical protein